MATAKECHALSSYFISKYEDTYGFKPALNRNKARWGWDGMLMDYSRNEITDLIDYYFETANDKKHSVEWFHNNYEKLIAGQQRSAEERRRRQALAEESKKRVESWRSSGKRGIESNQLSNEE